jgi:CheY-like chemotaxis protein
MMGSKVLLADDSVTIQKVVGIIFANEGFDITVVASGDDAIRKAVEIKPDVMLVDALMPGKNGYEVCREIRQNPALSHIGILLMTGAFEVVDEEKNRLSGADECIVKPFESQALIEATNRMITLTASRAAAVPSVQLTPQPAPQPVPPPPPAPAVEAPSVDDVWATGFDIEPAAEASPPPAFTAPPVPPPVAEVAPVKATADDDLWGAFDMDAFEETSVPVQTPMPTPVAAPAAEDFFSFDNEPSKPAEPAFDEFVLDEVVAAPQSETPPTATGFEPVGEEEISFGDEEPAAVEAVQHYATPAEDDFSTISFDEPVAPPAAPVPPPLPPVVEMAPPVVEMAPSVVPSLAPPAPEPPPIPEPIVPTAAAVPAALDEAQLRALLSSVSREMIEKIVWEVVPDLAETLIKEEIRKLKAGIS